MTDTPLLVPMRLNALVLGEEPANATPFLRFQMQYGALQQFRTADPPPFGGGSSTPPATGIYLHWTLPQALRQGVQNTDGTTTFPNIPNRWLVVRVQHGIAPADAVKAWVLESDYRDAQAGTSPFVDPYTTNDGVPQATRIGRALRLVPGLTSIPSQDKPFLQAMGPGSVYFAAFAPGVQDVLSFYDDVTGGDDAPPIGTGTFTYHVAGWYDGATGDPLRGTTWSASADPDQQGALVNDALDWVLYPQAGAAPPDWTLVHALVAGVPWDRTGSSPPPQNYPQDVPQTVKVAFGNTAADAMAAILRLQGTHDAATQADLLSAFQYGELEAFDHPGSSEALNNAIRRHWFLPSPGGTAWAVVNPQRTGSTATPAPAPVPLTDAQARALAALNAAQDRLDRQSRILESMQWVLFSLWWKYWYQENNSVPVDTNQQQFANQLACHAGLPTSGNPPPPCGDSTEWYHLRVRAQQAQVGTLKDQRDAAKAALKGMLDASTQGLREVPRPQFFSPNDPVMLATGLGRSTELDPGAAPVCRLASQAVSALAVGGVTYCAGGGCAHDVTGQMPPLHDPNHLLPAGVQALHTEAFFLSPSLFAQDVLGNAGQAHAVADAIAALPAPARGVAAFPPDAIARPDWAQPWVPLLLDWKVTVLQAPAYTAAVGDRENTFQSNYWSFDGTDFQWTGPTTTDGGNFDQDNLQMQLTGRTFITPQLTLTLADQLGEYVAKHQVRDPNLQALLQDLEASLQQVQTQDVLSQRLGGLRAAMVERDVTSTVPPFGDVQKVVGDYQHGYPRPWPNPIYTQVAPPWNFAPMAGTFWVVNGLSVIDSQGRTVDLTLANYSTDPQTSGSVSAYYFYPIAGRGLRSPTELDPRVGQGESTDATQRMMQLPPRMQQEARLAFELTSADGTDQPVWTDPALNPVCGWVVPNHLDRSIALYAADGTAWGEVYLSLHAGGTWIPAWQPDPTNPGAPQSVVDIPNPYVRRMVQGLWNRQDNGAGFYDFLQVIDETLWSIDPGASHQDEDLAVLVGRPLAVVRAELALQLRGLPRWSQDWPNTFGVPFPEVQDPPVVAPLAAVDGGVFDVTWPVRLGSQSLRTDGLVGYWMDDPAAPGAAYPVFNTVTLPAEPQTENYLAQIGANGDWLRLCFTDDTVDAPDAGKNQLARLTMLLDPSGQVHAYTGLLPVVEVNVPSVYTQPALETLAYVFRAGPFLTAPDQVRIPPPAEQKGTWGWFDHVLNATVPPGRADGKVRFSETPPLVKEGWLKFTPAPPVKPSGGRGD